MKVFALKRKAINLFKHKKYVCRASYSVFYLKMFMSTNTICVHGYKCKLMADTVSVFADT